MCLVCGESIEQTRVAPCSAVPAASWRDQENLKPPGGKTQTRWWRRPPGQYWMHAACLRIAAHPSVPLQFLDRAASEQARASLLDTVILCDTAPATSC
jgi:hypothetical protein